MVVGLGVLVGLGISIRVSKLVAPLLYGLDPGDPVTLALSAAVLTTVGVLAGWVPAQRAARVDPAEILRDR
jgi:ABC-type antimicrobial peptide transport system permease subunit